MVYVPVKWTVILGFLCFFFYGVVHFSQVHIFHLHCVDMGDVKKVRFRHSSGRECVSDVLLYILRRTHND